MFPDWLRGNYVAHRGLHDCRIGQNTARAFRNAVDNGYNIELDVQLTADKVPVVFHDFCTGGLTDTDGRVNEMTLEEISRVRYRNTGDPIPTFSEALAIVGGRAGLMIEIKKLEKDIYPLDDETENIVTPMLRGYRGNFVVKSFSPQCVKWFLTNTDFCCGLLSDRLKLSDYDREDEEAVRDILYGEKRIDFFDYNAALIGSELYNEVASLMPTVLWTIRSREKFDELKDRAENLIFEGFLPGNRR